MAWKGMFLEGGRVEGRRRGKAGSLTLWDRSLVHELRFSCLKACLFDVLFLMAKEETEWSVKGRRIIGQRKED